MRKEIIEKVRTKLALSNPKQFETPEMFSEEEVLASVRQNIIAELDAINLYEAHFHAIEDKELKDLLRHIIDEEKQHVAELQKYLLKKDPKQSEAFQKEH